ncbi:transglutaminase-like domain-containing protein [Tundrisphaera sp. TA3]|uniref:transglutaminase-like domain-containing protein n=1 Tax=Tundrisphaera sp. TA3 TaxID=3435775 RepID=UPI003EB8F5CC
MLIQVGYEMIFEVPSPAPMVLMLATHPDRDASIRRPGKLRVEPDIPVHEYMDGFGNRCARILAPPGRLRLSDDLIVEDSGLPDALVTDEVQHPVQDLPDDVLVYLLGSRYCEVDKLSDIAWSLFGHTPEGGRRAHAICDWVHNHVTFGYKYARPTKTAYDVYVEKQGVCRDFTHLALTFCRCMNIPARYTTGYLGDIGVPLSPDPMDFSGWFEVYLGGRWRTMDARHNKPRIGRIVMARGRDAVDVALTTSFGSARLDKFVVWSDEVESDPGPRN